MKKYKLVIKKDLHPRDRDLFSFWIYIKSGRWFHLDKLILNITLEKPIFSGRDTNIHPRAIFFIPANNFHLQFLNLVIARYY